MFYFTVPLAVLDTSSYKQLVIHSLSCRKSLSTQKERSRIRSVIPKILYRGSNSVSFEVTRDVINILADGMTIKIEVIISCMRNGRFYYQYQPDERPSFRNVFCAPVCMKSQVNYDTIRLGSVII